MGKQVRHPVGIVSGRQFQSSTIQLSLEQGKKQLNNAHRDGIKILGWLRGK